MKLLKQLRSILIGASAALGMGVSAQAHTISVGSFNSGSPGSVTIVLGTYDHGPNIFQGSISLISGPGIGAPVTNPFTSVITTKPLGLVDGLTNFYSDATNFNQGLPSDSFHSTTNISGRGPVVEWMASSFTGLTAGAYTYQLSGLTSQNWQNYGSNASNWTGTLVIPEAAISGVPDGGSTIAMLGLALTAVAGARRKFGI